jgi:acyl carrier protein
MRPSLEEIRTSIVNIVREVATAHGDDGEEIGPQTRLRADLGFSSMDIIHLLASMDMHFRSKLNYDLLLRRGDQLADDLSVAELSDFVFNHFEDQVAGPVAM